MALVTKMNRCAVCGSSQISLMADGKYYHCEACGATSNPTMPAADLAKVSVKAEVVNDEAKGPKISIQKYKNKTGVARRKGHRQKLTIVKITAIA